MFTERPKNSNGFPHRLLTGQPDLLCVPVTLEETRDALAQARERVGHSADRLAEVRTDLVEILEGLPPGAASPPSEELSGVHELDALIRCALHDRLDPLIKDLRALLQTGTEDE